MLNIEKCCRKIAKELNLDLQTVESIVKHQFEYTRELMQDPIDTRDILFNKLFKFKLKTRFKQDKSQKYTAR